jgi:hypothetical protein
MAQVEKDKIPQGEYARSLTAKYFPNGCIYCNAPVIFTDSKIVYGKSYGNIYLCSLCDAYVGIHKDSDEPLGRLADAVLRHWKKQAHDAFDQLWKGKSKIMKRHEAYKLMQNLMGLDPDFAHIGLFNEEQCQELIEKLKKNELITQ